MYEDIGKIVIEAERRAVIEGVPADVARTIFGKLEVDLVNAACSAARKERQFLLDLREAGPSAMADRYECSKKTVYRMRQAALNALGQKRSAA